MDKILTISGIIAGIAIVAILVAILGNVFGLFNFGAKKVKMINVEGTQYEEAVGKLAELGLDEDNIKVIYDSSSEEDGTVLEQSTKEGEEFSLKDTLRLTVAGQESSGDSGESGESGGSSQPAQTQPEETTDGEEVTVPSVVGLTQAEATEQLTTIGIVVTSTSQEYSDDVAEGRVISQSIEAGESVEAHSKITLVISKGKKETTYSYSIANPYDGECTYSIVELNKSGTIPKNGAINISDVTRSELTITLTYTPTFTTEDGNTITLDDKKETSTQTVQGTPN